MKPKVTVFTVCYNHAPYLQARIDSILNQTFQDFEWIIIDDASQDGSQTILEKLRGHPKVKILLLHTQNIGSYPSQNEALALAQGEYIYRAEGDDVCDPSFLEAEVTILDRYPQVGLVHTCCNVIDSEGYFIYYFREPPVKNIIDYDVLAEQIIPGRRSWVREIVQNYIASPTVMFRKKCYDQLGGFLTTLPKSADWEYWLRIMLYWDVAYIPIPLAAWRNHGSNWTGQRAYSQSPHILTEFYRVQDAAFAQAPPDIHRVELLRRIAVRRSSWWILATLQKATQHGRYGLLPGTLVHMMRRDPGLICDRRFAQFALSILPGGSYLRSAWHGLRFRKTKR